MKQIGLNEIFYFISMSLVIDVSRVAILLSRRLRCSTLEFWCCNWANDSGANVCLCYFHVFGGLECCGLVCCSTSKYIQYCHVLGQRFFSVTIVGSMSVAPSGRFPSFRESLASSLATCICARLVALHIASVSWACRCCLVLLRDFVCSSSKPRALWNTINNILHRTANRSLPTSSLWLPYHSYLPHTSLIKSQSFISTCKPTSHPPQLILSHLHPLLYSTLPLLSPYSKSTICSLNHLIHTVISILFLPPY